MYYHCRPLKYVEYGKVEPPPVDSIDWMLPLYRWLGHYCGYCPQVWLSRSCSSITGYRDNRRLKKSKFVISKRSETKISQDSVLFGFDIIKGFPVSYRHWEMVLNALINEDVFEKQDKAIEKMFNSMVQDCKEEHEEPDGEIADWISSGCNLETYLKQYLFQEVDQVVVPSLNLKSAKKIICHNEKQKKKLLKMGFIEDRILIKNIKTYRF